MNQLLVNVYNVSLTLFDLWVTSELLMAWGVSIAGAKPVAGRYCASFLTILPADLTPDTPVGCCSLPMPNYAVVLRCIQINYPTCWINQCLKSSSRMEVFIQTLNSVAAKFGHFKDTGYHSCSFYYLLWRNSWWNTGDADGLIEQVTGKPWKREQSFRLEMAILIFPSTWKLQDKHGWFCPSPCIQC